MSGTGIAGCGSNDGNQPLLVDREHRSIAGACQFGAFADNSFGPGIVDCHVDGTAGGNLAAADCKADSDLQQIHLRIRLHSQVFAGCDLRKVADLSQCAVIRNEDVDSAVSAEQDRLAKAKAVTAEFVDAVEAQLERQRKSLELIRNLDLPKAKPVKRAYDYESEKDPPREEAAAEIAAQIEENVGRITNGYPSPDMSAATRVMPPIDLSRDTSAKFADLQFGKNYHN
jgi:hypothetical protein